MKRSVDIPLARLTKIKNVKDLNYQYCKWKRGNCYILHRHDKNNKGVYKQFSENELDNLDKIGLFLEMMLSTKMHSIGMDNWDSLIHIKQVEFAV